MVPDRPRRAIRPDSLAGIRDNPAAAARRIGARWLSLLAVTVIALYLCWRMIQPFVLVILWATVLVIIFYPTHLRLLQRTRKPGWAALLSCIIASATILLPLTLVAIAVVNEASGVVTRLPSLVRSLFEENSFLQRWLGRYVNLHAFRDEAFWASKLQDSSGLIAAQTLELVGGLIGVALKIFLVVFAMYYLFRDAERIKTALREVLPLEPDQTDEIFRRTGEVITASVDGVLFIAAIQALLGLLAFWILGLPAPFLWAAAMFITAMIPAGGTFIVTVPAILYLLATHDWLRAIILTVWAVAVIAMSDNILRPRMVGGRTQLHELIIFFSVLGGLAIFGPLGLVVGPVVVAITLALLDIFHKADKPPGSPPEPTLIEQQAALRETPDSPPPPGAQLSPSPLSGDEGMAP